MRTILLGLNELNFTLIEKYIKENELPTFKKLFEQYGYTKTTSENEFHLLEPWIQWVTIHTGKTYQEHQVFRLGDIVERNDLTQLFEKLESQGCTVGAVSPFNADNRLQHPAFFVPDPWTKTKASGSFLLKKLSSAVSQAVNDNAQTKLTLSSLLFIFLGLLFYTPVRDYAWYLKTVFQVKKNVATKALILDKLLSDVFIHEWEKTKPDFSLLFLNSGAHLQHHYMFNSKVYDGPFRNPEWYCPAKQDPVLAIYQLYDAIIARLLKLPNIRLLLATGLSQQPHEALTFYWRLKNHKAFMQLLNITNFTALHPRMSRDFLITFATSAEAKAAEEKLLHCIAEDNTPIFTVDNRGNSLFVELTYPHEIKPHTTITTSSQAIPQFSTHVSLVALKNGEHNPTGYYLDTHSPSATSSIPLSSLYERIISNVKGN